MNGINNPEDFNEQNVFDENAVDIIDLEPPREGSPAFYARAVLQRVAKIPFPDWPRPVWISLAVLANILGLFFLLLPYLPLPTISFPGPVSQVQGPPPASASSSYIDFAASNGIAYVDTFHGLVSAYLAADGTLLWQRQLSDYPSRILATPAALYRFSSTDGYGQIESLRPGDGAPLWSQQVPPVSTLLMQSQNGSLYVDTGEGVVYALRESDGRLLWHFGSGMHAPLDAFFSVENGVAFIRTRQNIVYALRADNGVPVYQYDDNIPISIAGVADGVMYTESRIGMLQARKISDGSLLWQYHSIERSLSTPTIVGNIVYLNTDDGSLRALSSRNGKLLWRYSAKTVISPPAILGPIVYELLQDSSVIALRARDGSQLWRRQLPSPTVWTNTPPLVDSNILYINLNVPGSTVYALQTGNGHLLWSHMLLATTPLFFPTAMDGILYIGRNDFSIAAWQGSNGHALWQYTSTHPLVWYPQITNGILFAFSLDATIDAIDIGSGSVLWRYPSPGKGH